MDPLVETFRISSVRLVTSGRRPLVVLTSKSNVKRWVGSSTYALKMVGSAVDGLVRTHPVW